ncbi:hypothetical protein NMG60_11001353 [Bertholletia excelsa]
MKTQEEAMGSEACTQIMKGKRTKRPRQTNPIALTMSSTPSAISEGSITTTGSNHRGSDNYPALLPLATPSRAFAERIGVAEEAADMAHCLILLARGPTLKPSEPGAGKAGPPAFQCKTCNRCFPSFQALGGHRASHGKPRAAAEGRRSSAPPLGEEKGHLEVDALSLQVPRRVLSSNNRKSRVHECSFCGAEFSSGQALGGHMRRHRVAARSPEAQEVIKRTRSILSFDLNLPAPEDDSLEYKFSFASKEQLIVFSASSLVDCPY